MYVCVRMPYIMYELTVLLVVSVLSISFRWPDGLGRSYPTILRKLLKLKSFLDIYVCMYTSYSFEKKEKIQILPGQLTDHSCTGASRDRTWARRASKRPCRKEWRTSSRMWMRRSLLSRHPMYVCIYVCMYEYMHNWFMYVMWIHYSKEKELLHKKVHKYLTIGSEAQSQCECECMCM